MPKGSKALTLSIIIPAYNEEDHLGATLDSIAAQTVKPDEVIVVNNNSTDSTAELAAGYKFVKVLSVKEQGIVPARNRGFDSAEGSIIGRLDADSLLPEDWVARVKHFYSMSANRDRCLTGGGYFYNIRAPRLNGWFLSQLAYRLNRLVIGHYILWGSNMAFPARLWKEVRQDVCSRQDIHEDMDLAIHLNRLGYEIEYDESLRAGAMMRRFYSDRHAMHAHMSRWPRTLRTHGYGLWWFGSLGNALLWVGQPVVLAAEYFSHFVLRRKWLKNR